MAAHQKKEAPRALAISDLRAQFAGALEIDLHRVDATDPKLVAMVQTLTTLLSGSDKLPAILCAFEASPSRDDARAILEDCFRAKAFRSEVYSSSSLCNMAKVVSNNPLWPPAELLFLSYSLVKCNDEQPEPPVVTVYKWYADAIAQSCARVVHESRQSATSESGIESALTAVISQGWPSIVGVQQFSSVAYDLALDCYWRVVCATASSATPTPLLHRLAC